MSGKIRIIIADDQDVYRDGLQWLFMDHPEMTVVAEAANGQKLVELVTQYQPDVVLTDLLMPVMTGVQAIKKIAELHSNVKCIAISTFEYEQIIVEALEAGAKGYLSKHSDKSEIFDAIKTAYDGDIYYCSRTSPRMTKLITLSKFNPYVKLKIPLFTPKEKEIIHLVCQQQTNKEIAAGLFLSIRTVEKYREKIMEKMKVKSVAGIVIYAIKNGIVPLDDNRK